MTSFPYAFPCQTLNAGGAADAGRYTLQRTVALAESLLRGVIPDAGPIAITERDTDAGYLLSLFDAMLPASINDKGKEATITLQVPDASADSGVKKHVTTVQTVRDALATFHGTSQPYAVVNGTSRTLALALVWACGLVVPEIATVEVEGTDAELRDMSAQGNLIHAFARAMTYDSRVAYALSLYDDGVTTESGMMARAKVGRGIAQLMHSAAVAIRKHGITATDGKFPKLDKEGWRQVRDTEAGADVSSILDAADKAPTRYLSLKRLADIAGRAPAGVVGDVLRAIAADDSKALASLLGIPA